MNKLSFPIRVSILFPFLYWIWEILAGGLGADPAKELNKQTGLVSLIFLVINLWIGCLIWIFSTQKWQLNSMMRVLIQQRRFLGVTNFIIACAHIFLYLVIEGFEKKAYIQLIEKTYLIFGAIAFTGMFVLGVTSNNFSVKKLGGKKWKKLHQIVYGVFALILGHIFLIEKADLILFAQITFPILIFLLIRFLGAILKKLRH